MYVVGESVFSTYEIAMNAVVEEVGLPKKCLKIGPLKDPVRIYEKVVTTRSISVPSRPSRPNHFASPADQAMDDYADRFDDDVPPTACVADMLRCLTLCSNGLGMLALLLLLSQDGGFHLTVDGAGKVHLELVRTKNKCDPAKVPPVHLRNVLLNLKLHAKGTTVFVELQVHHEDIKHMVIRI